MYGSFELCILVHAYNLIMNFLIDHRDVCYCLHYHLGSFDSCMFCYVLETQYIGVFLWGPEQKRRDFINGKIEVQ